MSARPTQPGEVWRVDFGLAVKVRPALVMSDLPGIEFELRAEKTIIPPRANCEPMTPTAETLEAVILSGPRRGEIVTFPASSPQQPGAKDIETLNGALDELDHALQRVSTELRAALQSFKPKSTEA